MSHIRFFLLLLLFIPLISQGQESFKEEPDLVTDRPDQTESSLTIPLKHFQIESGFIFEKVSPEEKNTYYNTTLFRYGLIKRFEIRMAMDYIGSELKDTISNQFVTTNGFNPISFGGKIQVTHENGIIPEIAILAHVIIPKTGNKEFSINCLHPSLRLCISHSIAEKISIGYNLAVERDCTNDVFLGAGTLVMGFALSEKVGCFIETYGYTTETNDSDIRSDAGITWLLKNNFQLDLSAGLGLNSVAPDAFLGFGFSWRIPH